MAKAGIDWSIGGAAAWSPARTVRAGSVAYRREVMLPRLVAVAPAEVSDRTIPGVRRIVDRLGKALREERRRGKAGHWTYDLNRHVGLLQAVGAERRLLARLEANEAPQPRTRTGGRDGRPF